MRQIIFIVLATIGLVLSDYAVSAQPLSRLSFDFRGGMPFIITKAASVEMSPFGGTTMRYNFNGVLSVGIEGYGGAITGNTTNGYFRNNILQYGGFVGLNPLGFFNNRPKALERWNFILTYGSGRMDMYYTVPETSIDFVKHRNYYYYNFGLSIRYYANEMIDIVAGSNVNFTRTQGIDNVWDGNLDQFAMPYVGASIKILPYERKQPAEWAHVKLPYTTGSMAVTKELIADLKKELKADYQRNIDSVSANLRGEIKAVDTKVNTVTTKVDTIDTKVDLILDILGKWNTQGVSVNNNSTGNDANNGTNSNNGVNTNTADNSNGNTGGTNTGNKGNANNSETGSNTSASPTYKGKIVDQSKVKESYAIVVGSFQQEENALRASQKYKDKGWDAYILGNARSPYKRIVIFSNNYYEAAKIVTELRATESPDVWMLDIATGKGVFIK